MKTINWINRLFKAGALFSLTAMIAVVALQVFSRYFLESSPPWTEEAARILFVYAVAFGTGAGIKNGDFIRLDLIEKYLSPGAERWLDIVTDAVIIVFALFLVAGSIQFIGLGIDELSPALRLTMGYVFISIAIIGVAIGLFTAVHLWQKLKPKS